ncbi:MAG: LysE family transporter [Candidatus Kapabacteria bacterium]|nr:LysE family transporter [Candidatus Kapabacteria bacterium]
MIIAVLAGIIIGVVLALAPGPVGVSALKIGLNRNRRDGLGFVLGVGLSDFFYCTIAIFATSAIVSMVGNFSSNFPLITLAFQVIVVLLILVYGIYSLKTNKGNSSLNSGDELPNSLKINYLERKKGNNHFVLGLTVSLTSIANPTFFPTLTWTAFQVHHFRLFEPSLFNNFLFAVGFGLGNLLWLLAIISFLIRFRAKFSEKMLFRLRQFAGLTLIGVGTILSYKIFIITKWADIVRLLFAF